MKKMCFLTALIMAFGITANVSAVTVKLGTKTVINESYSFKVEFPEKPKMGESVLRITLWDKDGNQVTDLEVVGSYDMPSMAGQHSMAPKTVLTSQKGLYLFPIRFAMKGKWNITLIFKTKDTETEKGSELYTAELQVAI
jgi:hypothetical protein